MVDFSAIKSRSDNLKLSYITFYAKSQKHLRAVICHLPYNTRGEDISDRLLSLGLALLASNRFQPPIAHLQREHIPFTFVPHNLA
jgi:hypothetical protein